MSHPRLGLALGALAAFSVFTAEHEAGAGDWWYMKANCHPQYAGTLNWGFNQYGYYNTGGSIDLVCQQPHLWGANGYAGAQVYVYDHNANIDFVISLCAADYTGNPFPEACDDQYSTGMGFQQVTFGYNGDSATYYYYFKVSMPEYDSTYGASNLVSIFFQRN